MREMITLLSIRLNTLSLVLGAVLMASLSPAYGTDLPSTNPSEQLSAKSKLDQFWRNAQKEIDKSTLEIQAQNEAEQLRGVHFHKLMHGNTLKRQIAITFDDGPHPYFTAKLIDILKQYGARATFLLVGEKAVLQPGLVQAELAGGNSIGNHTFHHVNLTKVPEEDVAIEIQACGDVLEKITHQKPHLFRPPGGDYDLKVAEIMGSLGYTMIMWTDNPGDYAKPGDKRIEMRVLSKVDNGAIILLHDGIQETVGALPRILSELKGRGYEFVTIDEMIRSVAP